MLRTTLLAGAALALATSVPASAQTSWFANQPPAPGGFGRVVDEAQPTTVEPRAAEPPRAGQAEPAQVRAGVVNVSRSPEPTFSPDSYDLTVRAIERYRRIAAAGGFPQVPAGADLKPGASGPAVVALRKRLAVEGDLAETDTTNPVFDTGLAEALKRFQRRHGLSETGSVGKLTAGELAVPASVRVTQLSSSAARLSLDTFLFTQRYVVVNIPAAVVEAVDGGRVDRRFAAVVGKPDRASPQLAATIRAVNLNPTWTAPLSIVRKDIVPKMRSDPGYLARMNMRVLRGGVEVASSSIDWGTVGSPDFTIRQDPGPQNALGFVRIDMPNEHSVYLHDTPKRELFAGDLRFHSSGCARVESVRDLAAWLLAETPGWDRARIEREIAGKERVDVRLSKPVPTAWVYLTGWATRDGLVHFRRDVYGLDGRQAPSGPVIALSKPTNASAGGTGFILQSGPAVAKPPREVAFMDNQ